VHAQSAAGESCKSSSPAVHKRRASSYVDVVGSMSHRTTQSRLISWLALLPLLAASATPASSAQEQSLEPPYELVINSVVDSALDDLLIQMRRLPAIAPTLRADIREVAGAVDNKDAAGPPRIVIAVDRSTGSTGQPTAAHELLDTLLLQSARQKLSEFEVVETSPGVLKRVQYVLGGKLAPVNTLVTAPSGMFRVDLLLQDFKTSQIVAQVSVRFTAQGVDLKPLWCCLTH